MAQTIQNLNSADLDKLIIEYQPKDCSGNNIGDPVLALPTVQIANSSTAICNAEEIYQPIVEQLQASKNNDTEFLPLCVDNNGVKEKWYQRTRTVSSFNTGNVLDHIVEYTQDGINYTTTSPSGIITVGECEPAGVTNELEFTDAIPICVTSTTGATDTWYTREMIVWSVTGSSIVSRTTEYSSNGTTWSTTAPTGTFVLGACPTDLTCQITEAFGDNLSTLVASNNFIFEKPDCCKLQVVTSIGTFHILKGVATYTTSDFECPFTINSVSVVEGTCTLDEVHIIGNKLK